MFPNLQEYHRPDSIVDAVDLLGEAPGDRVVLAGGTRLIPDNIENYSEVVDIQNAVAGGVEVDSETLTVGALTRVADLQESEVLTDNNLEAVSRAALDRPSQLKRNQATVGGELAAADPRSELTTVLTALGAEVVVRGADGSNHIPVEDLYEPSGGTVLSAEEIITEIIVPVPAETDRLFYERLSRTENDISLVNCAVHAVPSTDGYDRVRVAAGAVDDRVVRLSNVEQFVEELDSWGPQSEEEITDILERTVNPPDDFRASADYRRTVLGVFIKRGITGENPANPKSNGEVEL